MVSSLSDDLFSRCFDALPQACFLLRAEQGQILYANWAASRLTGHEPAQLRLMHWLQLAGRGGSDSWQGLLDGKLEQVLVELDSGKGYPLTLKFQANRIRHQGDDVIQLVQHGSPLQRRGLDAELDRLSDGYWRWPCDGDEMLLSSRLCETLQRGSDENRIGRSQWLEAVHPRDRRQLEQLHQRLQHFPDQPCELEYQHRLPDGSWCWLHERASLQQGDEGPVILAVVLDVSESRQLSAEAETVRSRFEDFARSASDWFWETDAYLKLTFISRNLSDDTGIEMSDLLGQSLYTLMGPEQAGTRIQLQLTQPFRDTRIPIQQHWISLSGRPFYDEKGTLRGYRGVGQDIHSQVLLEQEIRNVREGMDIMMKHAPLGVALRQESGNFLHVNPHFLTLVGCSEDELAELYDSTERLHQLDDQCQPDGGIQACEFDYELDGERRVYGAMKFAIVQEINGPMVAIFLRDITAERVQQFEQQKSALVFNHISEGLLITDARLNILDVNDTLLKQSGYSREQLLESTPKIFQSGRHDRSFYREMRQQLELQGYWSGDIWNRSASGEIYRQHLALQVVKGTDDQIRNYVGFYSSSQDNRARSDAQRFAAQHDPLTGLANPLLFQDRMKQAIARARRRRYSVCFLLLDLVKFRELNNQHGHETGDLVLKKLARRLSDIAREEDTVCRWSADCFVVMMEDMDEKRQVEVTNRLGTLFERPLSLPGGQQLAPVVNLRQICFPEDGATLNRLSQKLRQALDR